MEQTVTIARSAVFAPLDDESRSDRVATRIEDAILFGIIGSGERLPAEPQLAARFGVATVTAREALESLRKSGLVETRRGRGGGTFVTLADETRRRMLLERVRLRSLADLADLGTFAVAITGEGLRLAAERATPRDIAGLARELQSADFATEASARRALGGLHLHAASLSQSVRLIRSQIRLQAGDGPMLWTCLAEAEWRAAARVSCTRIVEALDGGDGARAKSDFAKTADEAVRWLIHAKSMNHEVPA